MNMTVIADHAPGPVLAIVERYEGAVNYLYPLLLNMSHKHRVLRDAMLTALFEQYRLFYDAAKSSQVSRAYVADAGLAHIKGLLRFMADPARKLVSRRQYEVASVHLAETGAMLGGWIRHAQKR
ncbi:MAG: diversity-generating retroelement protein Avd [Pseudomonadota bacterium]|jgi:hypothetical protein